MHTMQRNKRNFSILHACKKYNRFALQGVINRNLQLFYTLELEDKYSNKTFKDVNCKVKSAIVSYNVIDRRPYISIYYFSN